MRLFLFLKDVFTSLGVKLVKLLCYKLGTKKV